MSVHLPPCVLKHAEDVLQRNWKDGLIYAGRTHFRQVWLRDALHSLPAYELSIPGSAKAFFTRLRSEHGIRPDILRIGKSNLLAHFLLRRTVKEDLLPVTREDKSGAIPADTAILFLLMNILLSDTHTRLLTREEEEHLIQFIIQHQDGQGLIFQTCCSDWTDTICRTPYSSYTNILLLALAAHNPSLFQDRGLSYQSLEQAYLATFGWPPRAYSSSPAFALDAFLLAWHYAVPIIKRPHTIPTPILTSGIPLHGRVRYHWTSSIPPLRWYHTRWSWPWLRSLGFAYAYEQGILSQNTCSQKDFQNFCMLLTTHGMPEVTYNDAPIRTLLYTAETSFTWTAACILLAWHPHIHAAWRSRLIGESS